MQNKCNSGAKLFQEIGVKILRWIESIWMIQNEELHGREENKKQLHMQEKTMRELEKLHNHKHEVLAQDRDLFSNESAKACPRGKTTKDLKCFVSIWGKTVQKSVETAKKHLITNV